MTLTLHPPIKPLADLHKVVRDAPTIEAGFFADIATERAKREPQSVVEARVRTSFDRLFAPGPINFGDDGSISLPLVAVDITGDSHVKAIVNAPALFGRIPAFVDAAWAEVKAQINESYLGVTETATVDEKKTRIAAINTRILEGQRLEVAAVNALRAAGEYVQLRAGLDIRAILGVDGPLPGRRRR